MASSFVILTPDGKTVKMGTTIIKDSEKFAEKYLENKHKVNPDADVYEYYNNGYIVKLITDKRVTTYEKHEIIDMGVWTAELEQHGVPHGVPNLAYLYNRILQTPLVHAVIQFDKHTVVKEEAVAIRELFHRYGMYYWQIVGIFEGTILCTRRK